MAFLILTIDKPGHKHVRDAQRAAHYRHLEAYLDKIIAGGGLRDDADAAFLGGVILFDAHTREEAEAFATGDPFAQAGLFERVEIIRWRPAFIDRRRVPPPSA
jgi:hypothetical protein